MKLNNLLFKIIVVFIILMILLIVVLIAEGINPVLWEHIFIYLFFKIIQ